MMMVMMMMVMVVMMMVVVAADDDKRVWGYSYGLMIAVMMDGVYGGGGCWWV
jgi:hypothetical protein